MGLRIHTNVASLTAQRHLGATTQRMQGHFARLASGLRIATAADDAAGLGISERMRSEIRSMTVAERNIQDGISLVRTAESALGEMSAFLIRTRELAISAMNGTLSTEGRTVLNQEYQALTEEITRIVNESEFNGAGLFNRPFSSDPIHIQVGTEAGDTVAVEGLRNMSNFGVIMGIFALDGPPSFPGIANRISDIVTDIVAGVRGELGATENRLQAALRAVQNTRENLTRAESRIRDVDVAEEAAALTRDSILQQAGTSALAQANIQPNLALELI